MVNRAMMQLLALVKKFMHTAHWELDIRVFMLMEYHNENRKGSVAKCVTPLFQMSPFNTFQATATGLKQKGLHLPKRNQSREQALKISWTCGRIGYVQPPLPRYCNNGDWPDPFRVWHWCQKRWWWWRQGSGETGEVLVLAFQDNR